MHCNIPTGIVVTDAVVVVACTEFIVTVGFEAIDMLTVTRTGRKE